MSISRRAFAGVAAGSLAASAPLRAGKLGPLTKGLRVGHRLTPKFTDDDLAYFKRLGIEYATIWTTSERCNYDYFAETKRRLEAAGLKLLNIGNLDLHCDPALTLGLPEREKKIEQYKQYLRDLGRAGIGYTTYAHMANIKMAPYYKTGEGNTRGISTRLFDLNEAKTLPYSHGRVYEEREIWASFTYFMKAVMPVAEQAGVRIGLHPDDPPVPSLGGVARIFRSASAYERAIEIAGSANFGLCFCVGTWAEGGGLLEKDVYEMIRTFGPRGRIFKVHFRNVDAPLPRFQETLVDAGYIDMEKVARLLAETGFNGVMIPDHVPGEGLRGENTAYTIGYMRAAVQQAHKQA